MANCLVVGYGSIGARHVRLLGELGHSVGVVSARPVGFQPSYFNLEEALAGHSPVYVVIANDTALHRATLAELESCGFQGTVLVEKPLYHQPRPLPENGFRAAFVGYQLRFHPLLQTLRRRLAGQRVLSVQAYVGQYLPHWRPGADYRSSSSASARRGGGVLRDLSHELDILTWLFGPWQRLAALGGRLGPLEIDSDDHWALLMSLRDCPLATLHLNYLDRTGRRELVVNTEDHSYGADLIAGTLTCDDRSEALHLSRDAIYLAEHRAALEGDGSWLCGLEEGLAVVAMIDAVERAAESGGWVEP